MPRKKELKFKVYLVTDNSEGHDWSNLEERKQELGINYFCHAVEHAPTTGKRHTHIAVEYSSLEIVTGKL